jgi:hypothetical protein
MAVDFPGVLPQVLLCQAFSLLKPLCIASNTGKIFIRSGRIKLSCCGAG